MTSRPLVRIALGAVVLGLVAAASFGLWYLFLRPDGPAPVSLDTAAATSQPSAEVATPTVAATTAADEPSTISEAAGLEGDWTVDQSIGSFSDFSGSFVGYRVQEELATIGATEAVGRTPDVTGTLTVDGTTITSVAMTADLTTLQSNDDRRDGQLARQGIETSQFPTATFALTQPIELDALPAEGETITVDATGDLTLHGVTRSVTIPLEARLVDGIVTVVGSLPIAFADYDIARPQSMIVLSVADEGVMELQLHFTRA